MGACEYSLPLHNVHTHAHTDIKRVKRGWLYVREYLLANIHKHTQAHISRAHVTGIGSRHKQTHDIKRV